jgi:suppressor of fused
MVIHPAVTSLHAGQTPMRVLEEPDVLVYRDTLPDHWHLVTEGIRATYEDPEAGGELTFRVPRAGSEDSPPNWAVQFFSKCARHFLYASSGFAEGHTLEIAGAVDGLPYAIGTLDPGLHPRAQHAGVEFVQLVGVTGDELAATMDWDTRKFVEIMRTRNPLLLTVPGRASLLGDPALAKMVADATDREGSSMTSLVPQEMTWREKESGLHVALSAIALPAFARILRGRTLHGREFVLISASDGAELRFSCAEEASWEVSDDGASVRLTRKLAERMIDALAEPHDRYAWPELRRFELAVLPA